MRLLLRSLSQNFAESVEALSRIGLRQRRWTGPGSFHSWQRIPGGVLVSTTRGALRIEILENVGVRIRCAGPLGFASESSNALAHQVSPDPDVRIEEDREALRVLGRPASVTLWKDQIRISVSDAEGRELLREAPGRQGGARFGGPAISHVLTDLPGSRYFGVGGQAAPLERTGRRFTMWNTDRFPWWNSGRPLYSSFPVYLVLREDSGSAHGVFYDNPHRSAFDFGARRDGRISWRAAGGELRYYVLPGPEPGAVLERYTRLTGRTPLPPRWALGYHQSRWSYYPAREVVRLAEEFRRRAIPCDVFHLDIHYMEGYRVFTWSREHFPDPAGLMAQLAAHGIKATVIVDPGVKIDEEYPVYAEGRARKAFVHWPDGREYVGRVWPGKVAFPDFSCADTRAWWGGLHRPLLDAGVHGIWNDMNEPSVFSFRRTMPDTIRFRDGGDGAAHDSLHNQYGLLMARATWEGCRALRPERRPFVLTRSGFAGVQRYAAMWTGDNLATWGHLRLAIPMLLSFGLSGVPFTGADIGGFFGSPSAELYTRFLQLGILMPFCRTHAYLHAPRREPWSFGPAHEQANRELIELRYRLLPHLYTAFRQHARDGRPVMRPLFWEHPRDAESLRVADQFLVGDHLLAAPVVYRGRDEREVYLPEGRWYRIGTDHPHDGGCRVTVPAPRAGRAALHGLPLFVRGGGVLAMQEVLQHVDERPLEALDLHVWPGGPAQSEVYEDAGDGYEHGSGEWRLTSIEVRPAGAETAISLRTGGHSGIGVPRFRLVLHGFGGAVSAVDAGGRALSLEESEGCALLRVDAGQAHDLRITPRSAGGGLAGRIR